MSQEPRQVDSNRRPKRRFRGMDVTFQEVLDIVESLPEYQQEDLIDIIRRRLIEQRRDKVAESIREAKEEYARGEVKKGTVDDLMKELSE
jgi:U3 small nucleolar ribonucleoprotein component